MAGLNPTFRLNPAATAAYQRGFRELRSVMGKNDPESIQKLGMQSAKRFVKNVVDITPPATGRADTSARQRGELAILDDLLKIALPAQAEGVTRAKAKELFASAEELLEVYARARAPSTGRVNPRNRKERLLVEQREFQRALKEIQKRVGWLAAALNAAAAKLGFRLPSWISRHGSKYGSIEVLSGSSGIKIRIIQNVPFADNVQGYSRKWNFALEKETKALANQVKAIVQKKARKAGFKMR